jgi:hypothetical protein
MEDGMTIAIDQAPFWEQRRGYGPIMDRMAAHEQARQAKAFREQKERDQMAVLRADGRTIGLAGKPGHAAMRAKRDRLIAEYKEKYGEDPRKPHGYKVDHRPCEYNADRHTWGSNRGKRPPVPREEILQRYREGQAKTRIARELGVGSGTVYRVLGNANDR